MGEEVAQRGVSDAERIEGETKFENPTSEQPVGSNVQRN